MTVLNLSFAASGFMGIYHLGAVEAFLRHGGRLLGSLGACAGASSGALVAAVMITAPDKLERCKEFTYGFADAVRRQRFGAVTPGYDFMLALRQKEQSRNSSQNVPILRAHVVGISPSVVKTERERESFCILTARDVRESRSEWGGSNIDLCDPQEILPSEAHTLATDRLHVSMTHSRSGKNHIVSRFTSREELIKALLASSYVPVYAGLKAVEFRGQKWIDGGFTDSLPIPPVGRTITVSPFAGSQDVCPVHRGRFNAQLRLPNMSVMLSVENIKRLNQALFPPSSGQHAVPARRRFQRCREVPEERGLDELTVKRTGGEKRRQKRGELHATSDGFEFISGRPQRVIEPPFKHRPQNPETENW
ncbi:Patatin-like phospholipase domain-containing protein 4 [Nibea albiflora]|uniref:Patatin-like phospholipase domain-containing protein 4 n=1 Tax=Nibea albiflora TaxID=240163 RepID=A0ACB7ERX7_NIBAL|nr:Patatin-like phospholipase domain-containing protein 4 [Nibea albiflora]